MNTRRPWLRRGALAATFVCTAILGAATTYADVDATGTRINGGRYRLQAVTTGDPCDSWKWELLAFSGDGVTLTTDDQATVEAEVGVGLYVFQATCFRGEGEEQTQESSVVTVDTRPSHLDNITVEEMWQEPFPGPLCLHCPDWLASPDDSIFEIRREGFIRTDIDLSTFVEYAEGLSMDPTPTPMMPQDVDLSFGAMDTFAATVNGEDLGTGLTITGYTYDGLEQITAGALNISEGGLVIGAFLIEAKGDPSPQPS